MKDDTYLYTNGLDTARREGDIALWRASHQANIACKKAIEESIRQGFDGMHLKADCAKEVVEEFGFKRVNWVLANTVQEKSWDGRGRPAGLKKTNFGTPMTGLAAAPMPLGAPSAVPAWATVRQHGGTAPSLWGCWMKNSCRIGPVRS